jgi:hypothetical protein
MGLRLALALNAGEPEQLGLLEEGDQAAVPAIGGRIGRPPGARNRRTAELAELLKRRHGRGPLELLFERMMAPVAELAAQLKADPWDVWREQNRLAEAVLPYVEQKMPIDVDVKQQREVTVHLVAPAGMEGEIPVALTIEHAPENSEENQALGDGPVLQLNAEELNG